MRQRPRTVRAREGAHDDLVLAVAIGVWWATRPAHVGQMHEWSS